MTPIGMDRYHLTKRLGGFEMIVLLKLVLIYDDVEESRLPPTSGSATAASYGWKVMIMSISFSLKSYNTNFLDLACVPASYVRKCALTTKFFSWICLSTYFIKRKLTAKIGLKRHLYLCSVLGTLPVYRSMWPWLSYVLCLCNCIPSCCNLISMA